MTAPKMIRWWKNGDHPGDQSTEQTVDGAVTLTPGKVVRPLDTDKQTLCGECGAPFAIHGEVQGDLVHPGDYVSVNKGKHGYTVTRPDPFAGQ